MSLTFGSGLISPRTFVSVPVGNINNALLIKDNLEKALRVGDPCTISWDLENGIGKSSGFKYLIKGLNIKEERMDMDGNTTEFSAQITLVEAGDELIKVN